MFRINLPAAAAASITEADDDDFLLLITRKPAVLHRMHALVSAL